MRHKVAGYKLGRNTAHRRSLLRNLVTSVIVEERVETTIPKAKAAKPIVEKMITLGKRGDLAARRLAGAYLMTDAALVKLFDTVGPRFGDRNGGYTRIIRTGWNKGDGADKAFLELLGSEKVLDEKKRSAPKPAPRKTPKPAKPWKTLKRKRSTTAASSRSRKKPKTRNNCSILSKARLKAVPFLCLVIPTWAVSPRRNLLLAAPDTSHQYMSSRAPRW
jgi:large subunit ribosomal protein L17